MLLKFALAVFPQSFLGRGTLKKQAPPSTNISGNFTALPTPLFMILKICAMYLLERGKQSVPFLFLAVNGCSF